jgi:hypothetical protein
MHVVARALISIGLIYASAVCAWAALPMRVRAIRGAIVVGSMIVCALSALIIPPDQKVFRGAVVIVGVITAIRVYSYWREKGGGGSLDYLRFLSIGMLRPHLVYSRHLNSQPRAIPREVARIGVAVAIAVIAWMTTMSLLLVQAKQSWLANHLILLAGFVVIMQSFGQASLGLWRLLGMRVKRPVADNILLSRTPADFWRRWSWPIHLWLYRYVYEPCGGRRRHVRAVLLVFLVSGLLHEVLAAVAIGRVTGHQTLYFITSAIGVLASPLLVRLARFGLTGEIVMRAVTILFLAATASLMFASFDMVLPIYRKHIWLNW